MSEKISLDQFLNDSNEEFLFTVEKLPDDESRVRLTPWTDEKSGCRCESAIHLKKDLIDEIRLTEYTHFCCGKRHKVVEVIFKKEASIPINEFLEFNEQKSKRPKIAHHRRETDEYGAPEGTILNNMKNVVPCYQPAGGCGTCRAFSSVCTSRCACYDYNAGSWYCCNEECCNSFPPPKEKSQTPKPNYFPDRRFYDYCNPCGATPCGIGYQPCWSDAYQRWDCFSC